jgi:AraC-like DNA-binding protein
MKSQSPQHSIQAWQFQEVLLERYEYAPGKAEVSAPHCHADYQLCLSLDFPGVYAYRGARHAVPIGSLSLLHPGEKHSASDPEERLHRVHYRLFYLPPSLLQNIAALWGNRPRHDPFFSTPILLTPGLFQRFLHLHQILGSAIPSLEQETLLHSLLLTLVLRHADGSYSPPLARPEPSLVSRVKTHIEDNYNQNLSLSALARWVGLHPVYLNQAFRQQVGVPPHAYQTQIRVDRAKRLLAVGFSIGDVAQEVGFYDQSHFGRYFRRFTGVTPARYQTLKTSYTPAPRWLHTEA